MFHEDRVMFSASYFGKFYFSQPYFPESDGDNVPTVGDTGFMLLLGVGKCLILTVLVGLYA